MSISSETRRAGPFAGNGSTVNFPFTFKVFTTAQVVVTRTVSGAETVLTLTTHYTVSLNSNQDTSPGGTVTMLTAPASGQSITITSNVANLQPTVLANLGGFYPEVINDSLDRATIQIQQLDERVDRALVIPVSSSGVSTQLPVPEAGKILGWNSSANGVANYTVTTVLPPNAAAIDALPYNAGDLIRATGADTFETLTTAELVPRQTLEAFGAVGDGVADDLAAINLALASGFPLAGTPGKTYRYVGRLAVPAYFNLDLQGATLRPVYAAATGDAANTRYAIYSSVGSFGAVNTVSSQTAGSRSVTLSATPSGIAVGDVIGFFATTLDGRWPITYRTVTAIATNDVEVDEIIPYAFGGTITCRKIVFNPEFTLMNGTIDCTDLEDGTAEITGVVYRVSYRDAVLRNVTVTNLNISQVSTDYIFQTDYCLDVVTDDCVAENAQRNGSFESCFRFRSYTARGNRYSGDGFGFAPVNGDTFWVADNEISGQYSEDPAGSLSVRGIRPIGCLEGYITSNVITDIDSGVKLEDCANIFVTENHIRYCNTGVNLSDQNPSTRSGGHVIADNIIEEYLAYGISLGTSAAGDGQWEAVTISRNRINTNNASASESVIIRGGTFVSDGNIITDWPSGMNPFRTVTIDGQLSKGILSSLYAFAGTASGRLGVSIDATHTGIAIDYDRVVCNAPGGKFAALPPRKFAPAVTICRQTVDMNSTADQALTLELPDGFTRYRLLSIVVTGNAAASSAVGGIYTDASKGGTAIVANTQGYTLITGASTNQQLTITNAGVQVMADMSLFFSLTTAHGTAATAELMILVYPVT